MDDLKPPRPILVCSSTHFVPFQNFVRAVVQLQKIERISAISYFYYKKPTRERETTKAKQQALFTYLLLRIMGATAKMKVIVKKRKRQRDKTEN